MTSQYLRSAYHTMVSGDLLLLNWCDHQATGITTPEGICCIHTYTGGPKLFGECIELVDPMPLYYCEVTTPDRSVCMHSHTWKPLTSQKHLQWLTLLLLYLGFTSCQGTDRALHASIHASSLPSPAHPFLHPKAFNPSS